MKTYYVKIKRRNGENVAKTELYLPEWAQVVDVANDLCCSVAMSMGLPKSAFYYVIE